MINVIENTIKTLDNESLMIFILSMFPFTELRASIPYGILFLDMYWLKVTLLSIIGNILIGVVIVYLLGPFMTLLLKLKASNKIINYIFNKTKKRSSLIEKRKFYGLILFIGIPLPFTGVWTGSLASYLFGFCKTQSILAIIIGVLISSAIMTILSLLGYLTIS